MSIFKNFFFYILTNKNGRTRCFFLSESCHVHEWKPQPVTWAGIMYILHAIDQCIQYVSQHLLSHLQQNDCPVRNVADGTFFNILYLKS